MSQCNCVGQCTCQHNHEHHAHQHGPNCGHTAVKHGDHVDYLHDGHLHHPHQGHVDEHRFEVNSTNPDVCKRIDCDCMEHACGPHCDCPHHGEEGHICGPECGCTCRVCGPDCGHEAVPHGDHIDYLVNGRLHHPHGDHCDDHGPVTLA